MAESLQMSSSSGHVFVPISQRNTSDLPRIDCSNLKTFTGEAMMSFHNISYRIQEKQGFLCYQKAFDKEMLSNIRHEHISGYYKITPYFFGKLISELVPRRLLPSVVFAVILYSIAGVKTGMKGFFGMIFTILMMAYSASSVPLSIGAGENAVAVPTLLVTIYFVFMLFFAGLSLYSGSFVPELSWLQLFNIPHYGFKALQHNEFLGQNFCPESNTVESSTCQNYVICTGEEFLTIQGIDLSPWGFWKNHVVLACIMIVLLFITYIQLFQSEESTFKFLLNVLRNTMMSRSRSLSHMLQ